MDMFNKVIKRTVCGVFINCKNDDGKKKKAIKETFERKLPKKI